MQIHHWQLRQDLPNLGHLDRKPYPQTLGTQECSLRTCLQRALRVTPTLSRDKIVTGSFDTTAKLWDTDSGKLLYTFAGHQNEVVAVAFDPHKSLCATGSMDQTAKLWDLETGKEHSTLKGHEG